MKKHHTISLTLLALVLAVGLFSLYQNIGGGKLAEDFQFITEPSQTYTPQEISDAADAVLHYFKGFSGATMTKLRYVDSFSSNETDNWAADYGADKGMVFFSDFTVGDATNTTLNPNSTYRDWQWYVIQTDAGDWSVVNQGQG